MISTLFAPPAPGFSERPWPPLRNALLAALEQVRPHACWGFGEVDVTTVLELIRSRSREMRVAISLQAYVVHTLAHAAVRHPAVLTYRHGKKLVTFADADVLTTIDRHIGGHRMAAAYCVRAAQTKSLAAINWELRRAITQPIPDDPAIPLRRRIARLPTWGRRLVNARVRTNPHLVRRLYGTIGLTSLQSPGLNQPFWGLPPLIGTYALGLGAITDRVHLGADGQLSNRKHLCLSGAADHGVIDGMSLSLFAGELQRTLSSGAALDDALVTETRRLLAAEPLRRSRSAPAR